MTIQNYSIATPPDIFELRLEVFYMKVLIVDDSKLSRKIIANILTRLGCQVISECDNGQKAVNEYFLLKPDLVIMDIIMPIMNGLEALEKIVTRDPCAKIVICSSMGQKDYIVKAIMSGAREFIVKPIEFERLKEVLDKLK